MNETFEIGRGLVIAVSESTPLPVGKRLRAVITRDDGTTTSAIAYKEWLLRRDPTPFEGEAFLLPGLLKADVPVGSEVALELVPNPIAKAHSAAVADRYRDLGWILTHELRATDDDEPYEYLFEWTRTGEAIRPAW